MSSGWVSSNQRLHNGKQQTNAATSKTAKKAINSRNNKEVGNSRHDERRTDVQGATDVRNSEIWPNSKHIKAAAGKSTNQKGWFGEELRTVCWRQPNSTATSLTIWRLTATIWVVPQR